MKIEDISFDAVKEYMLLPDEDGFTKESVDKVYMGRIYETVIGEGSGRYVDVIFAEGKCVIFGGYKSWITLDKYKVLLRDYNLKKIIKWQSIE
jgi:hypothetical protein